MSLKNHASQNETSHQLTTTGLWDALDMSITSQLVINQFEPVLAYEQQLTMFLKEPRVHCTTNVYGYWYSSQFPTSKIAAKKYLSAPLTSVESEQLFSSAGQLYANQHNSLSGVNAEKLLFLAYNIRLLGFYY